ncbi:RNA-binding cell elongation regulator Jag/EloR [Streptococcus sp. SGI.013]|uniref:RNA-binding cell elongation regulator Jag/EloR n=1 Tax=unclassified Streptococcus TaxID=2608887 RepID=UPI003D011E86
MGQFTGSTVEEAIQKGLKELRLSRLQARIKVVSREKKGFLGLFRKPAVVEVARLEDFSQTAELKSVMVEAEKLDSARQKKSSESLSLSLEESLSASSSESLSESLSDSLVQAASESFVEEFQSESVSSDEKSYPNISEAAEAIGNYIQTIIYEMDIEANVLLDYSRRVINLQIETSEPGRVIGYHGKVLKSLQLLAQNFLHDRYSKHFSVSLNVNDYIEHRTETLIEFAKKISNRVLETGQDYVMDPMTNSERKIVHKTIAQVSGVESYSEGSDPNRYIVVTLGD